jgi:Carboxypeptidase regulatory-like domain/TonB dependent receptor/TonB-dependent Receptor Plug Domain
MVSFATRFKTASLALVFSLSAAAHAQVDTGQVLGTVQDQQGAAVAGAQLTLTNSDENVSLAQRTDSRGGFDFASVKIGKYSLTAEASGFAKVTQTDVVVNIQQNVVANLILKPGSVQSTVEVTTAPAQLQTEDASVGNVVAAKTISDLPLNGRNYTFLAQLSAGVTQAQQDTRGLAANGGFSSNGTPPNQNNYLLDGVDNNSNLTDYLNGAFYVYLPSVDALQEFKVQTSNFSAEFGRAAGAVLNATTKSGTDRFHGSAFEFLRNDALDARNYFEYGPKGEFRLNQFGFTLGGPIFIPKLYDGRKHKTYIFGDYQGTRIIQASPITSSVPTALERSSGYTNFTELITGQSGTRTDLLGRTTAVGQVFDPATTRTVTAGQVDPVTGLTANGSGFVREPFPGNQVPSSRLDPNAVKLLDTFPAPNLAGVFSNYASAPNLVDTINQGDIRLDQVTGQKGQVFGRISYLREPTFIPAPFNTVAAGGAFATGSQVNDSKDDVLGWTYLISPTLVNEARGGYSRIGTSRYQPFASDLTIPGQYGIQGIPQFPNNGGLPTYNLAGLSQLGASPWLPTSETGTVVQATENITKISGAHSFKGGFAFQRAAISFFQPAYGRGNFTYSGKYTDVANTSASQAGSNTTIGTGGGNTGLAQLLLIPTPGTVTGAFNNVGGADGSEASNAADIAITRNYYGIYGQDDWKVSSKLTLNLGLRWEFIGHGVSAGDQQANFVPPTGNQGALFLMSNAVCNKNLSTSFLALTAQDGIAIKCSGIPGLVNTPKSNFAPRVGFAYLLGKHLVLRGAFGLFYGAPNNGDNLGTAGNYPFSYNFSYNAPDAGHPLTYPNGAIATLESGLSALNFIPLNVNAEGLGLSGVQLTYKTPYFQADNLAFEYQISPSTTFTLGYVGNQGRHLAVFAGTNNVSQILPPAYNPQLYIPWPDFARGFGYKITGANGNYNSMQTSIQRRVTSGLGMLANFTWSKCMTDARDGLDNNIGGYRAVDLPGFGIHGDYNECDYNVPLMFHASGTYELPFGRNKQFLGDSPGVVNALVGNWTTNVIATLQSGQPFTVPCTVGTAAGVGCYALTTGIDRYGQHNVNQWMNPAAFANPAVVTQVGQGGFAALGGEGSQVLGPGFHRMDLSFLKQIPIWEDFRAEFRAEIFNLTNTPQFGLPGFSGPGVVAAPGSLDFTNTTAFGRITATRDGAYDQREVQLALKLYW